MRDDTNQVIHQFKVTVFGNKKLIEQAEELVEPEEKVRFLSPTNATIVSPNLRKKEKVPGVIILTDSRIIFYNKVLRNNTTEIIPLDKVTTVNSHYNGLTGGKIDIFAETKSISFLVKYKLEVVEMVQITFLRAVDTYKKSQNTNQDELCINRKENHLNDIRELKSLLDDGIITEEDFNKKKKEILGV